MLYLDSRVHFDKVMIAAPIYQEFNCPGILIIDCFGDLDCIVTDGFSDFYRKRPCRCILNNFLITSLQGAVTLKQMNRVAIFISEDLYLDMFWLNQEFFDKDIVVAKCFLSFRLNQLKGRFHFFRCKAASHTTTAAASCCFQNNRESIFCCFCKSLICIFQRLCAARDCWHIACQGHFFSRKFIAHLPQNLRVRSDKDDAGIFTGFCKISILSKKAITRVDRIHFFSFGKIHDLVNCQVCPQWA